MYFPFGLLFLAVYAEATCNSWRPIKPVCGSDGNLYYNECHMKDEVYGKVPNGAIVFPVYPVAFSECADAVCDPLCNKFLAPVCANDGEILGNPCEFLNNVCERKQYAYEVDMEYCLKIKCPQQCAPGDAVCQKELRNCRTSWTSMGK